MERTACPYPIISNHFPFALVFIILNLTGAGGAGHTGPHLVARCSSHPWLSKCFFQVKLGRAGIHLHCSLNCPPLCVTECMI